MGFLIRYFRAPNQTFDVAFHILRVSLKYQVDVLSNDAIRVLRQLYPPTLEEWDDLQMKKIATRANSTQVALFAYEHDISELLPVACYALLCCQTSNGLSESDFPKSFLAFLENGRRNLLALLPKTTLQWMDVLPATQVYEPSWSCNIHCLWSCQFLFRTWLACDSDPQVNMLLCPFSFFTSASFAQDSAFLCSGCQKRMEAKHKEGRIKAWSAIPEAFGVKV
jgi:hypothetical protein